MLKGIAVSSGIGLAKAVVIKNKLPAMEPQLIRGEALDQELQKLKDAIALSHRQLETLYENAKEALGDDAKIIKAQITMLHDPEIRDDIQTAITKYLWNAAYAAQVVFDEQIEALSAIDDAYIRERVADFVDIKVRLLRNLTGNHFELTIGEEAILVCDMLTPSQTANLNPDYVKGLICESGGATSHAAILARGLGIPTIMGCADCTSTLGQQDSAGTHPLVFIDGSKGEAFIVTEAGERDRLRREIEQAAMVKADLLVLRDLPSVTADRKAIGLSANVGSLEEVPLSAQYGGEGIGLFRTEFLYMKGTEPPSEEAQFIIYKKTVEQLEGQKAVFRTFDIGGDKEVSCLHIPKEENPFLGWRAVRISLDERALFETQLRALLRASAFGSIQIMIPMISSVSELRAVREILEKVKADLREENIAFDEGIALGIMIEIPSAAICADTLIQEADFFSIGTNDLIQYTLAVDRGNDKISNYYDFFHPAVLRLVKQTIDAAREAGKPVSMCGEAAGDPVATLLLLGLGLREFSMSPAQLLKVKKIVNCVDMVFAETVAEAAMQLKTGEEIKGFLMGKLEAMELDYLIRV